LCFTFNTLGALNIGCHGYYVKDQRLPWQRATTHQVC